MGPGFEPLRAYKKERRDRMPGGVLLSLGEVAEWSIAPVLKTGVLRGTGGSNPSLSATESCKSKDLQDSFFL